MDIIEEYKLQQSWRHWEQYLAAIPLNTNDHVIDLGCSVGGVSNILANHAAFVTGVDVNSDFINYCTSIQFLNQRFICSDFSKLNYTSLLPITGIWASFSISYLKKSQEFLHSLFDILEPGGWIALVDVACFISGNMLPDSKHINLVKEFETESYKSGVYDFNFGSRMELFLTQAGFDIIHVNNDVNDAELNFNGVAESQILLNWKARLERMQGLRNRHADSYSEICKEVITSLASPEHRKRNNVRFVVAVKKRARL